MLTCEKLFQFKTASQLDILLLIGGLIAAVAVGIAVPLIHIFFSEIVEEMVMPLESLSSKDDSGQQIFLHSEEQMLEVFEDKVSTTCKKIAIIGAATFVAAYIQVGQF